MKKLCLILLALTLLATIAVAEQEEGSLNTFAENQILVQVVEVTLAQTQHLQHQQ